MEAAAKIDITPGMDRFQNVFGGLWRGAVGGVLSGVGMAILGGPPGTLAGGVLAGAILGGTDGRVIGLVAGMEAAQMLFVDSGE